MTRESLITRRGAFHLHCDSTFLSLHQPIDPALDFEANEMQDQDGNTILVQDVPVYQEKLDEDPDIRVFWSGDLTDQNGYYFTESGANICDDGDLGGTSDLHVLVRDENGQAKKDERGGIVNVILCPKSFDTTEQPASYREANVGLTQGANLAQAVPKSATLLHEIFHAINRGIFLGGTSEICRWNLVQYPCLCFRMFGRRANQLGTRQMTSPSALTSQTQTLKPHD
jgi:hypothetical protein